MGLPKKRIFITGAAGYVGAMLVEQFAQRDDVEAVLGLDIEAQPDMLHPYPVTWIQANTSDTSWQKRAADFAPHVVIHTAWHIRDMYGNKERQWQWNVTGSAAVFDFACTTPSVERLIHFSTAAIYGAYDSNTFDHLFTEDEPMRESEYRYGIEKRAAEDTLREKAKTCTHVAVAVVRPAAITGPRGRFARIRFGLQSALSGQLKGNFLYRIISLLVSYVPATPWWVRQFVHEDDVTDIVARLSFGEALSSRYEIFNLAPPGEPVFARHMARAVGKRVLPIMPWMVRLAYFCFWHVTRGKIPTSRGIWRFYSYPLLMDGSKVMRVLGYSYTHSSQDAFYYTDGRYTASVPSAHVRSKAKRPTLQTA